ncbi:MAG: c-type cytochrome [Pseudomonadota bacterium]
MSSRFRNSFAACAMLALLCSCGRERRQESGKTDVPPIVKSASPDTVFLGSSPPPVDRRAAAFEGNADAIAKGQQLFLWMNCVGCHGRGGGGMGPALMDDQWRYGGRIDQIASTIAEGRPNGMPSWRAKLTDEQIWQLAAYVRTLSGQVRKDAVGARTDTMSNTPPQTQIPPEPVKPADSARQ